MTRLQRLFHQVAGHSVSVECQKLGWVNAGGGEDCVEVDCVLCAQAKAWADQARRALMYQAAHSTPLIGQAKTRAATRSAPAVPGGWQDTVGWAAYIPNRSPASTSAS